ncbi:hypothetical protein D3C80_1223400 [compost metagenome]
MQRFDIAIAPLQRTQVAGRAVLHESDAPVALVQQIAAGLYAHLVMKETHLQGRPLRAVVPYFHDWHVCVGQHLFCGRAVEMAGHHQRCRRPAEKGPHRAFFLRFAEVTGRQQQLVAMAAEGVAERLDRLGEDRPGDVRYHHADNAPTGRCQPPGHQVGHIAQRLHGGFDTLAQRRRHLVWLVEVARHADGRNLSGPCHLGEGDTACAAALAGGILGLAHRAASWGNGAMVALTERRLANSFIAYQSDF